jgi:hypothetical protein
LKTQEKFEKPRDQPPIALYTKATQSWAIGLFFFKNTVQKQFEK